MEVVIKDSRLFIHLVFFHGVMNIVLLELVAHYLAQ